MARDHQTNPNTLERIFSKYGFNVNGIFSCNHQVFDTVYILYSYICLRIVSWAPRIVSSMAYIGQARDGNDARNDAKFRLCLSPTPKMYANTHLSTHTLVKNIHRERKAWIICQESENNRLGTLAVDGAGSRSCAV